MTLYRLIKKLHTMKRPAGPEAIDPMASVASRQKSKEPLQTKNWS
jgi:hypothetical protein